MKYKKINKETIVLIEKHSGKIINKEVKLLISEIDWEDRRNQTRATDLDRGHLASLQSDIASRGLNNMPLVELDKESALYKIVSGHHRLNALKNLINDSKFKLDRIPCVSVSFNSAIDREFFMQAQNHHPPTKPHTRKDAVRFIKNMRTLGFFDSANGNMEIIENKVNTLLQSHYCRLTSTKRQDVYHDAFKDMEITRVKTILKPDLKKKTKSLYESLKSFSWTTGNYLCWGDTNSVRKAIAVALEKRVKMIDQGTTKATDPKGKIVVVTHFEVKDIKALKEQRDQFLHTEALMNRFAYAPGNLVLINEICFLAQIDGKTGIKEEKEIRYKWNYDTESFTKK